MDELNLPHNYAYFKLKNATSTEIQSYLISIVKHYPKTKMSNLWKIQFLDRTNNCGNDYEQLFANCIGNLTLEEWEEIDKKMMANKNPTDR